MPSEQSAAQQTGIMATQMSAIRKAIVGRSHEQEATLKWFSEVQFHDKQRDTSSKHHQGTCQWFLDSDRFRDWFTDLQNTTLWCTGDPGTGKTILMSKAVDYAADVKQSDIAIAYIYCDYKDPNTQSEAELLRSLVRQLIEQTSTVPPIAKTFWEKYRTKQRFPTNQEWMVLMQSICDLFKRTYIFVDALDECAALTRGGFVRLLKQIRTFTHLMVTSRPHLKLDKTWPDIVRMDVVAHPSDIQSYVESQVDSNDRLGAFFKMEPKLRIDIICKLTENAAGMFLHAHLQFLQLCGEPSLAKLKKSLDSMPTDIHELYQEDFTRIKMQSSSDAKLALRALSFVASAKRQLTVQELCHALSVEAGDVNLDKDKFPLASILSDISAGLMRVDEESNSTGLVHYTLQEHLNKKPEYLSTQPEIELGAACFTYLSFRIFALGPCADETALMQRLQEYQFLEYASRYCGEHIVHNQQHEKLSSLHLFMKDEAKTASLLQILHIPALRKKGWHDCFPKQSTPLHIAAYWGLDDALAAVIRDGFQVNVQDSFGSTALLLTARHGHVMAARCLIKHGADVRIENYRGESAIYWAARNGHQHVVELLLAEDCDAFTEDSEGWTALDWATVKGFDAVATTILDMSSHSDEALIRINKALILGAEAGNQMIVQTLLQHGAQQDWKDELGSTAMHWAVPEGHEQVVLVLMDHGANVNSRDIYGNTSLHWSIPHQPVAQLLLSRGAEIDAMNDLGQTALLWCAQDGQEEVFGFLLEKGANHDHQDLFGITALHATALKGHESMARQLLTRGANPNLKDKDGWTPLHAAAVKQHKNIVQLLLSHGVQNGVEICSWVASRHQDAKKRALLDHMARRKSEGSTAMTGIRWAVSEGHTGKLQTILDAGADVEAEDIGGDTALTIGAWMGQEHTVRLLLENGAEVNRRDRSGKSPLHFAAEEGYMGVTRLLVEHGADLEAEDCGSTALLLAAKGGHTKVVAYLLEKGANVNVEDYHGRRALHWAAKHGTLAKPAMLTERGAVVSVTDRWGRTPLMWAIENTNFRMVGFLLKSGADCTATAEDNSTALHLAAYCGNEEMIDKLLTKGAAIDARTREEVTTLHISALMGHESAVQLLLTRGADPDAKAQWSRDYPDGDLPSTSADSEEDQPSEWEDLADDFDDGGDDDASAYRPDTGENLHTTPLISNLVRRRLLELGVDVNDGHEVCWNARAFAKVSGKKKATLRLLEHR